MGRAGGAAPSSVNPLQRGRGEGRRSLGRSQPPHRGALKKDSAAGHSRAHPAASSPGSPPGLPATASPLANAQMHQAAASAPSQELGTLTRAGPDGEVISQGSVWESEEGAAASLFSPTPLRGEAPRRVPPGKANPQSERPAGPLAAEGRTPALTAPAGSKGGVAAERALHMFRVLMSPSFYNSRPGAERKSHHVPRGRENREQLSACAGPRRLRLSLSSFSDFLTSQSSPRHFLPPLPPLHQLQSRSKYFLKNFASPQLKELLGCPNSNRRCCARGSLSTRAFSKTCAATLRQPRPAPGSRVPRLPLESPLRPPPFPEAVPGSRLGSLRRLRAQVSRLTPPDKLGCLLGGTRGTSLRKRKESSAQPSRRDCPASPDSTAGLGARGRPCTTVRAWPEPRHLWSGCRFSPSRATAGADCERVGESRVFLRRLEP